MLYNVTGIKFNFKFCIRVPQKGINYINVFSELNNNCNTNDGDFQKKGEGGYGVLPRVTIKNKIGKWENEKVYRVHR